MIRPEGGKFTVYDHTGKKKLGTYNTRKEAEARLKQVERFSKRKKKRSKRTAKSASK